MMAPMPKSVRGQIDWFQLMLYKTVQEGHNDSSGRQEIMGFAQTALNELENSAQRNSTPYYEIYERWLHWIGNPKSLGWHLDFLERLFSALPGSLVTGRKPSLSVYPYSCTFKSMIRGSQISIDLNENLILMTEKETGAMAEAISRRDMTALRKICRKVMERDDSHAISEFFQSRIKVGPEPNERGRFYDLGEIFERVNHDYFGGKMEKPVIRWTSGVNRRRMGWYKVNEDLLEVNLGLDRKSVPVYVLEFIMYHELLHKYVGVKQVHGRVLAHTAEFRQLERQFQKYDEAEAFLSRRFGR